jgi:hypothetical protein
MAVSAADLVYLREQDKKEESLPSHSDDAVRVLLGIAKDGKRSVVLELSGEGTGRHIEEWRMKDQR